MEMILFFNSKNFLCRERKNAASLIFYGFSISHPSAYTANPELKKRFMYIFDYFFLIFKHFNHPSSIPNRKKITSGSCIDNEIEN